MAVSVVVEGRARGTVVFASLDAGGRTIGKHVSSQKLVVDTDDGRAVEVRIDDAATQFAPLDVETAPWGELERRAEAAPFRAKGPGPHVEASLSVASIGEGTRVRVEGVALDEGLAGGGLRDASSRVVTKLRATRVTIGEAAAAAAARKARRDAERDRPPTPQEESAPVMSVLEGLFVAAAAGVAALGATSTYLPRIVDCAVSAVALVLVALMMRLMRATRRTAFYGASERALPSGSFAGTGVLTAIALAIPCTLVDYPNNRDDDGTLVCATAALFVVWIGGLAAMAWDAFRATRDTTKLAKVIGGAPPHGSHPEDGAWGATEGVVVARTAHEVLGALAPLSVLVEEEFNTGSTPNTTRYAVVGKPFVVRTASGAEVEVDPSGATWASRIRVRSGLRPSKVSRKVPIFADVVPDGAHVRVVGRITGGKRIAGTGPESLFVLASTSPRGLSVRPGAMERNAVLALTVLVIAALLALTAWHPFLPDFYLPGDGG